MPLLDLYYRSCICLYKNSYRRIKLLKPFNVDAYGTSNGSVTRCVCVWEARVSVESVAPSRGPG